MKIKNSNNYGTELENKRTFISSWKEGVMEEVRVWDDVCDGLFIVQQWVRRIRVLVHVQREKSQRVWDRQALTVERLQSACFISAFIGWNMNAFSSDDVMCETKTEALKWFYVYELLMQTKLTSLRSGFFYFLCAENDQTTAFVQFSHLLPLSINCDKPLSLNDADVSWLLKTVIESHISEVMLRVLRSDGSENESERQAEEWRWGRSGESLGLY